MTLQCKAIGDCIWGPCSAPDCANDLDANHSYELHLVVQNFRNPRRSLWKHTYHALAVEFYTSASAISI